MTAFKLSLQLLTVCLLVSDQGTLNTKIFPLAYNKNTPPQACDGFTGPTETGGAINAPLDSNGHNTYLGYKYFPFSQSQGYTPSTCASACTSQTAYNSRHKAADGTYQTCVRAPVNSAACLSFPHPNADLLLSPSSTLMSFLKMAYLKVGDPHQSQNSTFNK